MPPSVKEKDLFVNKVGGLVPLKVRGQRVKKVRVTWISLKRNFIPFTFIVHGMIQIIISICLSIYKVPLGSSYESSVVISAIFSVGKFSLTLGALCGFVLSLVLPPAPRFREVPYFPLEEDGNDVWKS